MIQRVSVGRIDSVYRLTSCGDKGEGRDKSDARVNLGQSRMSQFSHSSIIYQVPSSYHGSRHQTYVKEQKNILGYPQGERGQTNK